VSYAVVIVNWNGAADTVACLDSVLSGSKSAIAIVVDNGSADDSLARVAAALVEHGIEPLCGTAAAWPTSWGASRAMLIDAGENLGFAAGCNLGLRAAQAAGFRDVVFLNNDTLVEGDALDRIVARLSGPSKPFACLPMLLVHDTGRIWNCGGEIYPFGLRRYHLAGQPRGVGTARGEIGCSFFTGCCFAVRTDDFARRGGFSERFFFGEEDFELALWMRERGLAALCVTSAVVRHKVSASFDAAANARQAPKVFVYYLNRFIHMRLRLGEWRWWVWSAAYLPYVALLLLRGGTVGARELPSFFRRLLGRARRMDRVTRADFEAVMAGKL
jgi:GT2 family glycosyltransferase